MIKLIYLIIILLLLFLLLLINNTSTFGNNNTIINFCSFYTEGPPNDEGNNVSWCVPEILKGATGHFNKITFYTPKKLKLLGYGKYLREYEDSPIIRHKTILKTFLKKIDIEKFINDLEDLEDNENIELDYDPSDLSSCIVLIKIKHHSLNSHNMDLFFLFQFHTLFN